MKRSAFTLVELLVVIAIIGLLSTIAVTASGNARNKARLAAGQSFEQSVYQKLGDRLEGEWKFETLGATTPDTSGNGRTGTVTNGTSVAGISGNALSLTGTGYIDVGTISITDNVTVSAWIRAASQSSYVSGFIVGKNTANENWELFFENSSLKWRGGSWIDQVNCAAPTADAWHYVVGTQSGNQASVYIDGKLCGSASAVPIGNSNGTVQIGTFGSGSYPFNGYIDEVRVYSGSLLEP